MDFVLGGVSDLFKDQSQLRGKSSSLKMLHYNLPWRYVHLCVSRHFNSQYGLILEPYANVVLSNVGVGSIYWIVGHIS